MTDPAIRSRQAQSVLDNDTFQAVCTELEQDAIANIRATSTPDGLLAARAMLLAVAEIQKRLEHLVKSYQFTQARSASPPLA
jgi:hypothetical protein